MAIKQSRLIYLCVTCCGWIDIYIVGAASELVPPWTLLNAEPSLRLRNVPLFLIPGVGNDEADDDSGDDPEFDVDSDDDVIGDEVVDVVVVDVGRRGIDADNLGE